jgi:ubiquinone/menaquinone biosynthesis C-methylase UbiE
MEIDQNSTKNMHDIFACPLCKQKIGPEECDSCKLKFEIIKNSDITSYICKDMYATELEYKHSMSVIDFWGNGWKKRLKEPEHKFLYEMDTKELKLYAANSLKNCRSENSLMSKVNFPILNGGIALNIGCGAGVESLILANGGAFCVAMDITVPAAEAGQTLIRKVGNGIGIQADSRYIPMQDKSVDVVYSSGVLHHSKNLPNSISEIHRVLKPGGTAYVMLYATWSLMFIQERLLRLTGEDAWETDGRTNPLTTTYTVAQCEELFNQFDRVRVEKVGGRMDHIKIIGKSLPKSWNKFVDKSLGPTINIVAYK